MSDSCMVSLWL